MADPRDHRHYNNRDDLVRRVEQLERALFHEDGSSRLQIIEDMLSASKLIAGVVTWLSIVGGFVVTGLLYLKGKL